MAEEYRQIIRAHRRDAIEALRKDKKDGNLTEDDLSLFRKGKFKTSRINSEKKVEDLLKEKRKRDHGNLAKARAGAPACRSPRRNKFYKAWVNGCGPCGMNQSEGWKALTIGQSTPLPKAEGRSGAGCQRIFHALTKRTMAKQEVLEKYGPLQRKKIPAHVAIIMDGNGRWAKGAPYAANM